ncbi:hypothetical protein M409DRAFT_62477 [Zasmidium cellare ATCC 36951]|uniref:Capsule polysaccharide biosynthesis protein n=1 Tax=Zasmidium cellare ATCC 36951 TaxID=1080233 RepID=A0A6A6D078_ZASCE|nr:uncharacterized protein M409DRAFT_62477 [Zasmidium cellare ATCC 36951]KAF2172781.1 hypothetical protein M409DRAFT_62477 [Zasmidium cellare ATCC 36951]
METPKFTIPSANSSELKVVEPKDTRSDQEILEALSQHVPVTSEKNVWAFWDKGIRKMPGWCQRNVINWVRLNSTSSNPWTVRVVDAIPTSPNYALNFADGSLLPQTFVHGNMQGPYIGPHSADFLRGALLYTHGGVFMDVGNILFRDLDRIGWKELEDPASPYQICTPIMYGQVIANHFTMARKANPFIKRWHDLFISFWQGRTDHKGIIANPLLEFATKLDFSDGQASDFHWDFKVDAQTVFEYISQVLAWVRLTMLEDAGDGFSCTDYWQHNVLVFNALQECWGAEATVGFNGEKKYRLLSTRIDSDPSSEDHQEAEKLVWRLLTKSSLQKITHGKHLTNDTHLGILWDENEGKDVEPGTFAELLRYGATRFEQTRGDIVRMEATKPAVTMKKGVFEP